jgi:hypothetical protein
VYIDVYYYIPTENQINTCILVYSQAGKEREGGERREEREGKEGGREGGRRGGGEEGRRGGGEEGRRGGGEEGRRGGGEEGRRGGGEEGRRGGGEEGRRGGGEEGRRGGGEEGRRGGGGEEGRIIDHGLNLAKGVRETVSDVHAALVGTCASPDDLKPSWWAAQEGHRARPAAVACPNTALELIFSWNTLEGGSVTSHPLQSHSITKLHVTSQLM